MPQRAVLDRLHRRAARDAKAIASLRAALRGLYEATHDYLNELDHDGRMAEGSARLNAALADAFAALAGGHGR